MEIRENVDVKPAPEYYQTVFDFFNDWDVIDLELINRQLMRQTIPPWGIC